MLELGCGSKDWRILYSNVPMDCRIQSMYNIESVMHLTSVPCALNDAHVSTDILYMKS